MKTDTKCNSAPLSCAVTARFLAWVLAALCLIPVAGRAQILVANEGNNTIGKYDATTGAPINPSFISSGLDFPNGLALSGDKLYVSNYSGNTIGLYNAKTGA